MSVTSSTLYTCMHSRAGGSCCCSPQWSYFCFSWTIEHFVFTTKRAELSWSKPPATPYFQHVLTSDQLMRTAFVTQNKPNVTRRLWEWSRYLKRNKELRAPSSQGLDKCPNHTQPREHPLPWQAFIIKITWKVKSLNSSALMQTKLNHITERTFSKRIMTKWLTPT